MVKRLIPLAATLALGALAAGGAELRLRPGMTGVPDLGAISCETFTHMHPAGPTGMEQAVLTWAQGYFYGLSGQTTNQILADQPASEGRWSFDTLTGHIVTFCAENPQASIPEAVADLWSKLTPSARD